MKKSSPKKENKLDLEEVKGQYQDYPYPYRNPEDENRRLLATCGESLAELNHFLYKGKRDFQSKFRVLIAGGGTGDSSTFIGEQLKNHPKAEIIYLDFSRASMEIAKERARIRGIKNIKFINDSIYNIPDLNLGKFDYINCCGVLHHLQDPPLGLKILQESLTPDGGMFIMVYAKYGRTGLYQIQDLMKMVNTDIKERTQEVHNCNIIVNSLPDSNWFSRGSDLLGDHKHYGDIGLYDMFLHKQDRCYSIPELYDFVKNAGLNFIDFLVPSDRIIFDLNKWISDHELLNRIKKFDIIKQQAICEIIHGSIIKHSIYISNNKDAAATLDDTDNIPFFFGINAVPQMIIDAIESGQVAIGQNANFTLNNSYIKNHNINIPISIYTKYLFRNMLSGTNSIVEIFDLIRKDMQSNAQDNLLIAEIKNVLSPFIHAGVLLLCDKSVQIT
jgi:SAM-dependent methyltransferase